MQKIRNAVIIIVLCVVGGYQARKHAPLRLGLPPADGLHDALAANHALDASRPGLHLSNSDDDQLHDSVAANAVPGFHQHGAHGDTEDTTPPPPRGGGDGNVGSFNGPSQVSQLQGPTPLSPSSPASPYQPPK